MEKVSLEKVGGAGAEAKTKPRYLSPNPPKEGVGLAS